MADADLFPWEKPYVESHQRVAADDDIATMGERIENLSRALNGIYAARHAGHLPDQLSDRAVEVVRATISYLLRVQQIESLHYALDLNPLSDEQRAGTLAALADLARRFPEHANRIRPS